jgi:hypothetical protein
VSEVLYILEHATNELLCIEYFTATKMEMQQMMELLLKEVRASREDFLAKLDANLAKAETSRDMIGRREKPIEGT